MRLPMELCFPHSSKNIVGVDILRFLSCTIPDFRGISACFMLIFKSQLLQAVIKLTDPNIDSFCGGNNVLVKCL